MALAAPCGSGRRATMFWGAGGGAAATGTRLGPQEAASRTRSRTRQADRMALCPSQRDGEVGAAQADDTDGSFERDGPRGEFGDAAGEVGEYPARHPEEEAELAVGGFEKESIDLEFGAGTEAEASAVLENRTESAVGAGLEDVVGQQVHAGGSGQGLLAAADGRCTGYSF